jgi:hypothetical protein
MAATDKSQRKRPRANRFALATLLPVLLLVSTASTQGATYCQPQMYCVDTAPGFSEAPLPPPTPADCINGGDNDGDGASDMACGGDDCDDNDPNRFPGNVEVCDAANHDEDCDPNTIGSLDADGDGFIDYGCFDVP